MADPRLVAMLASQGPKAINNPVARFVMNLPAGQKGVDASRALAQYGYSSDAIANAIKQQAPKRQEQAAAEPSSIQAKLLARVRTGSETGFAVPGPGVLPGFALRPEVRAAFESMGGVAGFDVSNLSPEEEKGLAFIIDPKWVAERQAAQ
jgi:hypothetical protein